ncbi:hypothetical protein AB2B38_012630 [Balneola sp. MJW-20]|uniref:hypothetical protein n=1 Tax=Gracilimonas aurantiaca TaxID=3234185 RepID=UPI00346535AB
MSTKFKNLRNDLEDLEQSGQLGMESSSSGSRRGHNSSKISNYVLLFAFIATLIFYVGTKMDGPNIQIPPVNDLIENMNAPNEELLAGMGEWMQEMGYGELSREELLALRAEGVTATYTSGIRDAGYTDVTLEQLVDLQQGDVSDTFARMMKELGYTLTVEEMIDLRRNDVTAFFTSNMYDLGYTAEELSVENLKRLRSVGVTHQLAERLMEQNGERLTIDELIRYRISNQ